MHYPHALWYTDIIAHQTDRIFFFSQEKENKQYSRNSSVETDITLSTGIVSSMLRKLTKIILTDFCFIIVIDIVSASNI